MSTVFKVFLAVLLMTLGAAAYADPPSRVARLNYIGAPVSFAPADEPDAWIHAVLNRRSRTAIAVGRRHGSRGVAMWAPATAAARLRASIFDGATAPYRCVLQRRLNLRVRACAG